MNMKNIYSVLLEEENKNNQSNQYLPTNVDALALAMVNVSFDRGSMDSLAIIVLALDCTTCSTQSYSQGGSSLQNNSNFEIEKEENVDYLHSGTYP